MAENSIWSPPPHLVSLDTGEAHVWCVQLEQLGDRLEMFRRTLQEDELSRADRFHFERHRKDFVVAHGALRYVLGLYLDTKAEDLRFSHGAYGKPALDGEHKSSRLQFNMSHSHGVALFAVAEDKQLGVDVEHIRADLASEDIAQRFFSPLEAETLSAVPAAERVTAFFRCWTRKEAYIKATGRGLSQPLDGFDVTLAPGVAAALLRAQEDDATRWTLFDLDVGSDYSAALAVEGPVTNLQCWRGLL